MSYTNYIISNAVLMKENEPVIFQIRINEDNQEIIRKKLESVYSQIVEILKSYKEQGLIKSIWRPKNKQMTEHLNKLVLAKHEIKSTISKIKTMYT